MNQARTIALFLGFATLLPGAAMGSEVGAMDVQEQARVLHDGEIVELHETGFVMLAEFSSGVALKIDMPWTLWTNNGTCMERAWAARDTCESLTENDDCCQRKAVELANICLIGGTGETADGARWAQECDSEDTGGPGGPGDEDDSCGPDEEVTGEEVTVELNGVEQTCRYSGTITHRPDEFGFCDSYVDSGGLSDCTVVGTESADTAGKGEKAAEYFGL